jgi:hypothetical protein
VFVAAAAAVAAGLLLPVAETGCVAAVVADAADIVAIVLDVA